VPVDGFKLNPGGGVPLRLQVNGAVPFVAAKVKVEYACPVKPFGGVVEVIKSAGLTASKNACDACCVGVPLSVTVKLNPKVPVPVGVPLIVPLELNPRPAGKKEP
jgi:hypothetical protein